jgi:hypothetical protein
MIVLKYPKLLFLFNRDDENASKCSVLSNWLRKSLGNGKNNATLKMVQPKFSTGLGEIDGKMISTWNLGNTFILIGVEQIEKILCVSSNFSPFRRNNCMQFYQ